MKDDQKKYNTVVLGVTGGIGSGKSSVCRILASLGALYIQADRIAKDLLSWDDEIIRSVKKLLGPGSYDQSGAPDKRFIAEKIFTSPEARKKLDHIVHPAVIKIIKDEISKGKKSKVLPMIAVEAALIYEAKTEDLYDYIAVVDSSEENRLKRLLKRDRITKSEIMRKMSSQLAVGEKLQKCDFIIKNDSTAADLEQRTRFLFSILTVVSAGKP